MGKVATQIAKAAAKNQKVARLSQDDVIEQAGDLLGTVAITNDLPIDFVGVTVSILREPGTNRLLAVILSPVDMHADEPYARYQVNPDAVVKPKAPKLIIPN